MTAPTLLPACPCPEHPAAVLVPLPGGGARGTCPVDQRSHQMTPPEVRPGAGQACAPGATAIYTPPGGAQ